MIASLANVYAVVLAAGASSRLGRPKQLLTWRNRYLLEHAIEHADALLTGRVVVVLGAHSEAIQAAADLDNVVLAYNPDWREGIASSIRAGVDALPALAEAALLLLCDQPMIGREQLQRLLEAWRNEPSRIVASHYNNSVGVPALFPAVYFAALRELRGDRGAKSLLLDRRQTLIEIPLRQAEWDIDVMDDFNHLNEHHDAEE